MVQFNVLCLLCTILGLPLNLIFICLFRENYLSREADVLKLKFEEWQSMANLKSQVYEINVLESPKSCKQPKGG